MQSGRTMMFHKFCRSKSALTARRAALLVALTSTVLAVGTATSQERKVPDTYKAKTTGMTPDGLELKFDIIDWSDDQARADVISALTSEGDVSKALDELPTVGVIWPSGSGVGYALKYAEREMVDDGGEQLTFVTDKPLGQYSFKPWTVNSGTAKKDTAYSVIELHIDSKGHGVGTLSLAADVVFDRDAHTVSLAGAGDASGNVLTAVTHEPKPYWAEGRS